MKESQYFQYNFLIVGLIALLNCPDRNDYNLPLAIFAYLVWNYQYERSQRHRVIWLFILSLIFDLLWILTVSVAIWRNMTITNKLEGLTQVLSIVNLCYKLIIIIYAIVSIEDCQNLFKWDAFKAEVLQQKWCNDVFQLKWAMSYISIFYFWIRLKVVQIYIPKSFKRKAEFLYKLVFQCQENKLLNLNHPKRRCVPFSCIGWIFILWSRKDFLGIE